MSETGTNVESILSRIDQQEESERPGLLAIRAELLKAHPKWSVDKAHYEAKIAWTGRNWEAK